MKILLRPTPSAARGGPIFIAMAGALLGPIDGLLAIVAEFATPNAFQYATSYIVLLIALILATLIGISAGLFGSAGGYGLMLLFRRLRIPAALGLFLGTAVTADAIAALLLHTLVWEADPLAEIPLVPVLVGAIVLTVIWAYLPPRRRSDAVT